MPRQKVNKNLTPITISLDESEKKDLKNIAVSKKLTVSDLIRFWIKKYKDK